jgi:hypothetical protein
MQLTDLNRPMTLGYQAMLSRVAIDDEVAKPMSGVSPGSSASFNLMAGPPRYSHLCLPTHGNDPRWERKSLFIPYTVGPLRKTLTGPLAALREGLWTSRDYCAPTGQAPYES